MTYQNTGKNIYNFYNSRDFYMVGVQIYNILRGTSTTIDWVNYSLIGIINLISLFEELKVPFIW